MAINASKIQGGGKDRVEQPVLDAGVYPGRLVQVTDLGLQAQAAFQGQEKAPANEINLTYELVDTFMVDEEGNDIEDKPRWVSEKIPLHNIKADRAKSTQRYLALDPDMLFGGDFAKVVDIPVNITIVQNKKADRTYANVAGIAAMRPKDAQKCAPLQNEVKLFDLEEPDLAVFNGLPDWLKEKIKRNLNFQGSKLAVLLGGGQDEEAAPKKTKKEAAAEQDDDQDKPW